MPHWSQCPWHSWLVSWSRPWSIGPVYALLPALANSGILGIMDHIILRLVGILLKSRWKLLVNAKNLICGKSRHTSAHISKYSWLKKSPATWIRIYPLLVLFRYFTSWNLNSARLTVPRLYYQSMLDVHLDTAYTPWKRSS